MKTLAKSVAVLLAVVSLAGCIDMKQVIKLKPDGSGTIEVTVLMSKMVLGQMKAMMSQMEKEMGGNKAGQQEMFKEEEAKQKAAKMGEGVTFVSFKKLETDRGEGFVAVYAFKDITKVKVDQNPSDAMPSNMPSDGQQKTKEEIAFEFKKGKVSLLTIKMPKDKAVNDKDDKTTKEDDKSSANEQEDAAGMEMAKQFFADMKITMIIEVQGKIVKTNATHVKNTQITLMEMDFGKLIQDAQKFKEYNKAKPKTLEESKKLMSQIPGMKIELNDVVKVEFK